MKILRWGYVLPRLIVVTAIVLAVRFGLDPALKWALVTGGEAAVGAKVEVAEIATSLTDGTLIIRDLAIANPKKPMRNLLALGEARLQIDVAALTHDCFVVRDGTVTGLVFDGQRSTSGELPESPVVESAGPSVLDPWLASAGEYGADWLDQLSNRLSSDLIEQLQSPQVADELIDRWPAQYAQLKSDVKSLEQRARSLQTKCRELQKNPLRSIEGLQALNSELAAAQQQLATVRRQLEALPHQAEADREAVLAARQHDEKFVRERLKFDELNQERLTRALLGEEAARGLAQALDWVRWSRSQTPHGPAKPVRWRGTNVHFASPRPRLLVERLELETEMSLGGRHVGLVGTLTNATTEPQLCREPLILNLRGDNLLVELTIDHRKPTSQERLDVVCQAFALPGRRLGKSEKLAIELAPGTASLHAHVRLIGDDLSGEIRYRQASTRISASASGERRQQLATLVNQALVGIDHVVVDMTLAGTLDRPTFDLQSNLGPELAAGIKSATENWLAERSKSLLAEANREVEAQLTKLHEARTAAEKQLLAQLGEHQQLFGQLASSFTGAGLPVPQLSQKFDFSTLRK